MTSFHVRPTDDSPEVDGATPKGCAHWGCRRAGMLALVEAGGTSYWCREHLSQHLYRHLVHRAPLAAIPTHPAARRVRVVPPPAR